MKYSPVHLGRWTTETEPRQEIHSRKHYEIGSEWPQTCKFSHHKGKSIRPTVKKCSRVVLVKNTLQLVMKNREKTFSPIIQNSRLSNMHPWHSPANWYSLVQNSNSIMSWRELGKELVMKNFGKNPNNFPHKGCKIYPPAFPQGL